jgi:oxygen-independent coproporphyrinogen-3 oxidase
MTFTSLYIHIPFCLHRCGYCDFNTYAGLQELIPAYSQVVCKELEYISQSAPGEIRIHTIYFGGGTPSLLPVGQVENILHRIREYLHLSPLAEITMEANPGTLTLEYLYQISALGVNRLSLGMQSAQPRELALLERQHSYGEVVEAVGWARRAGISNLNLDLIFGLPGQELPAWLASLESALSLQPEHLSLYALTLEHGTPLQHAITSGRLPEPDPDLAADMYEAGRDLLQSAGFVHYEISNWAKGKDGGETFACLHNLQYWRSLPYIGMGAGAHGFINHYRTVNVAMPKAYIDRLVNAAHSNKHSGNFPSSPATTEMNFISTETEIGETMMMGLRLVEEGVSQGDFKQRYGLHFEDKFSPQIERLVSLGLLEWAGTHMDRLRLTMKGQLLGNLVFSEFI